MLKIILLQIGATAIAAIAAAGFCGFGDAGLRAGLSTALGGAACIVPNSLFGLRLAIEGQRGGRASFATFFVWEFVKLALTVAILFAVAWRFHRLNWLALLIGFIVALKSYLLTLLFDRSPR